MTKDANINLELNHNQNRSKSKLITFKSVTAFSYTTLITTLIETMSSKGRTEDH